MRGGLSVGEWVGRYKGRSAVVIGNGESRLRFDLQEIPTGIATFGCNALYRDYQPTVLGAVDVKMLEEIVSSTYTGILLAPKTRTLQVEKASDELEVISFDLVRGWSTGPMTLFSAAFFGCNPVFILGFDMGFSYRENLVNNVYRGTKNYKPIESGLTHYEAWIPQVEEVITEFPSTQFVQLGEPTLVELGIETGSWDTVLRS